MATDWTSDRRLDILVLGPMGADDSAASTLPIRDALLALLAEPEFQALLERYGIGDDYRVVVPEGQVQSEIVENVLNLLDTADLVVFNLNAKPDQPDRANVFYELGLVHALGIRSMAVVLDGAEVPFYALTMNQSRVADFEIATLQDALRPSLREFLDLDNRTTSFLNDRVTQFYRLPVVDISAAVGLATGYWENFIGRLITDGGFAAYYPDKIRAVRYVRPSTLRSTYSQDRRALMDALAAAGFELQTERLDPPPGEGRNQLWFDHVEGIVLDVPRTIYPLRSSPRMLSYLDRTRNPPSEGARRLFDQRRDQLEQALLDRVESAIRFHIDYNASRVRENLFGFTTIEAAPAEVQRLLGT